MIDIVFHPALESLTVCKPDHRFKSRDLIIIFDVNGQGVEHGWHLWALDRASCAALCRRVR